MRTLVETRLTPHGESVIIYAPLDLRELWNQGIE
jgi:hypothetical protein